MEPGSLGKPMMMGPYRRNIADIAELFAQQGALQLVRNEAEILDFWRKTSDPEQNAIMGEAAISVVNANRGTLDKVLDVVFHDLESSKVE